MKHLLLLLVASLTCTLAASQPVRPAPTLDMLVADLESGDDGPRQARARQLLPLRGPEVAWKMLPLLDDPRGLVHFTALRVLEDVIHESASYPAREDRERVAQAVLSLVTPESSTLRKETGLRLLPYAAGEDHSLVHVAALLREGDLREKARASLEELGTNNALNVLCSALSGADASFRVDLLRAVASFGPRTAYLRGGG